MSGKECTCGATFRGGEDYRDHLPCPGTKEEQENSALAALIKELTDASVSMQDGIAALKVEVDGLKPRIQLRDNQLRIALEALRAVNMSPGDVLLARAAVAKIEKMEKEGLNGA